MKPLLLVIILLYLPQISISQPAKPTINWKYYSTEKGDLEVPKGSGQQTSCAVFDIDKGRVNDFDRKTLNQKQRWKIQFTRRFGKPATF